MSVKLQAIVNFFRDEPRLVGRGESTVESNYVSNVYYKPDLGFLRATVEASMRDKNYDVKIELNTEGEVALATCQCRRGNFRCYHMAAVLVYASKKTISGHNNFSRRKKTSAKFKHTTSTDIPFTHPRKFTCLRRRYTDEDTELFKKKLLSFSPTIGFSWLLSEEPDPLIMLKLPKVEDIIFSKEFSCSETSCVYLCDRLRLTWDEVLTTVELTKGMGPNSLENVVKKCRIATSHFGAILSAYENQKFPPSLFKNILGSYTLDSVREEQWKQQKIQGAIQLFEEHTGLKVNATGIWLHPSGLFCATPDGLIENDAIIEVKCPFRFSSLDKPLLETLKKEKEYILIHDEEMEQAILNTEHHHFHQVQGKLYLTNRKTCYFVIWSPNDVIITKIEKNDQWAHQLEKLADFYKKYFFNILLDRNKFF